MTADIRLKFNFSSWRKMDRGNLVFGGIIAVASFAVLLFSAEGLILYQEFFIAKEKPQPAVVARPLTDEKLDEALKIISDREKEFNKVLQGR